MPEVVLSLVCTSQSISRWCYAIMFSGWSVAAAITWSILCVLNSS